MFDETDLTTDEDALVGKAADEFLAALSRDESPSISDFARHYPSIANVIQRTFPALAAMDNSRKIPPSVEPEDSEKPPQSLGDFQIAHELGRGGMGVVYEAEQLSMGRKVALKILPLAAMLDRKRLQRFKNEVRAAAALDHAHCVPIYAVGEERGVHYYAMKLIQGQSLALVIEDLQGQAKLADVQRMQNYTFSTPNGHSLATKNESEEVSFNDTTHTIESSLDTLSFSKSSNRREYFHKIAKLGAQAADALHHAHEQGVVHRDIKPGNLLFDLEGKLWITDFGLAQIETDVGITMTGDLLGTLRYMSPEQALGKRVHIDHRTDIYSLGATLYELLTLQPAISGDNRGQMLKQITERNLKPIRKLDSAIPVELETIIAKSMEAEPVERYSTAAELADDLRRFLDNKPILARRSTVAERTVKWIRRYPAWAALFFVVLLSMSALSIGAFWHATQVERQANRLTNELFKNEQLRRVASLELAKNQRLRQEAESQEAKMRRSRYLVDVELAARSIQDGLFEKARTQLLKYLPPSQYATDRDFPWYYLWQKCRHAKRIFSGHEGLVTTCLLVPQKKIIVSGSDDRTVRFFDLETEEEIDCLTNFVTRINAIVMTPDEKRLVVGADGGELCVLDISKISEGTVPQKMAQLAGHSDDVLCLAISPDGSQLATAGADNTILIWDLAEMTLLQRLSGHSEWVRSVDFAPNGKTLVSVGHDGYLIHWDLENASEFYRDTIVEKEHSLGLSVRFHPSGEYLAVGNSRGELYIIGLSNYEKISSFIMNTAWIRSIDFSADGSLLAIAGNDPTIRLLRLDDEMRMTAWRTLRGHQTESWSATFLDNGQSVLSCGIDGSSMLRTILTEKKKKLSPEELLKDHRLTNERTRPRLTTTINRDKVLLCGKFRILLSDGKEQHIPFEVSKLREHGTNGGAISRNGQWLATLQGKRLRLAKVHQAERGYSVYPQKKDRSAKVYKVDFHPKEDLMALAASGSRIQILSIPSRKVLKNLRPYDMAECADVLFTSDGQYLAACYSGTYDAKPATLVVWELDSYEEVARVEGVERLLAVSPQGKSLALANRDQTLQIWNVDTQTTELTLEGHTTKLVSGDFSPNGKYLVTTAESGPMKLWSVDTGQLVIDMDEGLIIPQFVFMSDNTAVASNIQPKMHGGELNFQHELVDLTPTQTQIQSQVSTK